MVGLGPGDPELVTVKAKKVIESSRLIFVPSMKSDLSSRAYHTAPVSYTHLDVYKRQKVSYRLKFIYFL